MSSAWTNWINNVKCYQGGTYYKPDSNINGSQIISWQNTSTKTRWTPQTNKVDSCFWSKTKGIIGFVNRLMTNQDSNDGYDLGMLEQGGGEQHIILRYQDNQREGYGLEFNQ